MLLLLAMVLCHIAFTNSGHNFKLSQNLEIYNALFKELDMFYVDTIQPDKLTSDAINGMLTKLDPYTQYYTEKESEQFEQMTTGEYGGIGSVIQQRDSIVIISDPYEGRPAQVAGVKAGDIIVMIDTIPMKGKTTSEVSDMLKGQPNTRFTLTLKREGVDSLIVKEIVRKKISMEAVPYFGMLNDSIGYIYLSSFTEKAAKEVTAALKELKEKQGATSLVLDLRGNPGGLLEDAIKIVNLFVPKGETVLSTRGKVRQWDRSYKTTSNPVAPDMPLVVLVDNSSASASEIVSGALQDLDRAVIMGTRTFGKGLVQSTRPLPYNTMLKVTTAKYYIPSGRSIQAIDYSHRNPDGSVGRIPDSLTTVYNTANGREVRDGGGINPDIEIKSERLSNITAYLLRDMMIFDFATTYENEHPTLVPIEEFVVTDTLYDAFKEFVIAKEFTYDRGSEKALKELKEIAEFEGYMESAAEAFALLDEKLKHNLDQDLDTFREDISEMLAAEIVKRYYYQKGEIVEMLKTDKGVERAEELLENLPEYYKVLTPPAK